MHIETKFSNGDKVFYATTHSAYKALPCTECNETGRLQIQGKAMTVACQECSGRGHRPSYSEIVAHAEPLTIGRVGVEITDSPGLEGESMFSNYGPQQERREHYMCLETGVGSGSVYNAEDLFATEAEALERAAWKVVEAKRYREEEQAREEERRQQLARQYEYAEA